MCGSCAREGWMIGDDDDMIGSGGDDDLSNWWDGIRKCDVPLCCGKDGGTGQRAPSEQWFLTGILKTMDEFLLMTEIVEMLQYIITEWDSN